MAKDVKKCFEKWVQSTCFIDSNKKSNRKKKKIATSRNISFNNDSPSHSILTPLLNQPSQNHTYTNESIGPIATYGNLSPYTSFHSPSLLNNQYSQNYVTTNRDEFINSIDINNNISLNNSSLYSSLTPLSGQPSQYLVSGDFNSDISFNFDPPSHSTLTSSLNQPFQNHTYTNESIAIGSNYPRVPLIPLLNQPSQNHVNTNEDKFISPIATDSNISPYTSSHSPLSSLSGQPSQYIVSNDVNFVDNSPYSYSQSSQYFVSNKCMYEYK
ncbi:hypothetical protein Glove_74g127 [Diversispora epigaea]|uniref:Uncharacterized protein n=1 Tax=Diversispora epigaea TaxID=1348612 RepID=A0A397J927_9GLOM|nr:hypothetical protein Glove_74g127 [Diversispora epigaea]